MKQCQLNEKQALRYTCTRTPDGAAIALIQAPIFRSGKGRAPVQPYREGTPGPYAPESYLCPMPRAHTLFATVAQHSGIGAERLNLGRGECMIRAGDAVHHLYHIKKGAVRAVYRTENEEFNIRFGYRGSVITGLPSFFDGSPSPFSLEALRSTVVERLPKRDYLHFVAHHPEGETIHRRMLESLVGQLMERELDLLTPKPADRYHRVLERSPQLFQEVPAYHIANYLRMTPETLSRLRKS